MCNEHLVVFIPIPFCILLIIHQFVQLEISKDIKSDGRHTLHDNIYSQYR